MGAEIYLRLVEPVEVVVVEHLAMALELLTNVQEVEVEAAQTALLVEPRHPQGLGEALSALLADAQRRRTMGGAGRALVEREFTVERMADKTMAAYQSALEAGQGAWRVLVKWIVWVMQQAWQRQ